MKKLLFYLLALLILIPSFSYAAVHVNGYFRKNGTYVAPYYRSNPDSNPYNNYNYPGNTNPYTGKTATGNTDTYLYDYYNKSTGSGTSLYSGTSYTAPTYKYTAPLLIIKNVSYVVKTWVTNNPGVSCGASTFLRAKERTECYNYVSDINNYTWDVTTDEFDGVHYNYDKVTGITTSCPDGYRILYSAATGKVESCVGE